MRLPRWKREQKERRSRKFTILVRSAIIFLFLGFLIWSGGLAFRLFASSKLANNGRITIVLATSPVLLVSLESQGGTIFLSIPENTYVEVAHGFGSYRIGAVSSLGEQEKLKGLLSETTQEFLGVPVDGWIGPENGSWKLDGGKEEILDLKNRILSWKILMQPKDIISFTQNLKTNLTIFDLARVWFRVKNTRFDKVQFLDLGQTTVLSNLLLADGSKALSVDSSLLDARCLGLFKDVKVSDEHLLIEILNGTDKQGLANRVSRLITNLGGIVVNVSNNPQKVDECQVRGESKYLKSFTGFRLSQIFKCKTLLERSSDSRADLQMVIGADYWRKLYQR